MLVRAERLRVLLGRRRVENGHGRIVGRRNLVLEIDDVVRHRIEPSLHLGAGLIDRLLLRFLRRARCPPEDEDPAENDHTEDDPAPRESPAPTGLCTSDRSVDQRRHEQFDHLGVRCAVQRGVGRGVELLPAVDVSLRCPRDRFRRNHEHGSGAAHGIERVVGEDRRSTGGFGCQDRDGEVAAGEPGLRDGVLDGLRIRPRTRLDEEPLRLERRRHLDGLGGADEHHDRCNGEEDSLHPVSVPNPSHGPVISRRPHAGRTPGSRAARPCAASDTGTTPSRTGRRDEAGSRRR